MIDIFFHDKTGVVSGFPGQIDGFEYADGNGEIHYYRLFDGVGIMLLRLEMEAYTEIRTQIGRLEVNFCVNGRFETSFSMRDRVLLKPGDMAVSCYDGFHGSSSASCFPQKIRNSSLFRRTLHMDLSYSLIMQSLLINVPISIIQTMRAVCTLTIRRSAWSGRCRKE